MSTLETEVLRKERSVLEKKRVSCRLNGRMPEDRRAIEVYERVLGDFGTNAAGDLLRRWVLSGFLVWSREGGLGTLESFPPKEPIHPSINGNTSSNDARVLSANESDIPDIESDTPMEVMEVASVPEVPSSPQAGFVGMLGMGISRGQPRE